MSIKQRAASSDPPSHADSASPRSSVSRTPPRQHSPTPHRPNSFLAAAFLRLCDLGLLGIIFIAPLLMGGRSALGKLVFVGFAIVCAGSWLLRQCVVAEGRWRQTAGQWILLAGVGLLLLQLTPLPNAAMHALAPKTVELLPLWSTDGDGLRAGFGTWDRITMNPTATRGALVLLLAYGMTFLVVVQRANRLSDVERLLKWLALAATGLAAVALVQYFTPNGKFLWLFEHPYRAADEVQASFENRNHFAHMMALGVGPLCACLWSALRRGDQRRGMSVRAAATTTLASLAPAAFALAIGLVLFAGFMSLSRGGALAMTAAILVCTVCFYAFRLVKDKRFAIGLAAIAVLLGVTIFVYGYDRVASRLDDFASLSADELDRSGARRELWAANWHAFLQSPWLGFGAGGHRNFYKLFFPGSPDVEFTHAENGYLQIASETGLFGLTLLAASIGLCGWWFYHGVRRARSDRALAFLAAVSSGLAASLVHSLVDFVWYIPACMSWTVILIALACRLSRLAEAPTSGGADARRLPLAACAAMLGFVAILSVWMFRDRLGPALGEPYWNDYLRLSAELDQSQSIAGDDTASNQSPAGDENAARLLREMTDSLTKYVAVDPAYDRAHIRLAAVALRQFQHEQSTAINPMDLAQIRDAALASQFTSRDDLNEWLDRAVGPHRELLDAALRQARQGLRLCPLEGEGYVLLANLCFLEGAADDAKSAFIDQALRVRPFDGYVAMAAGKEAAISGDLATAAGHWQRAYQSGTRHQYELVALLAGQTPVPFLLSTFEPAAEQWAPFFAVYLNLQDRDELRQVCDYFLSKARQQPAGASAGLWHALGRGYQTVGQQPFAESCARQAVTMAPEDIGSRTLLATILLDGQNYREAEEQLRWCLQRTTADSRLKGLLEIAVKGRVAGHDGARNPVVVARSPDRDTGTTEGLKK